MNQENIDKSSIKVRLHFILHCNIKLNLYIVNSIVTWNLKSTIVKKLNLKQLLYIQCDYFDFDYWSNLVPSYLFI